MALPKVNPASFRTKIKAFMAKCKLNGNMTYFWHEKGMSDMRGNKRYWILVFKKPMFYKSKKSEPKWLSQIKVWDTQEECWVNEISCDFYLSEMHFSCDHASQLIMFAASTPRGDRAYIYDFLGNRPIVNQTISHKQNSLISWKVIDNKTVVFNDDFSWYHMSVVDRKAINPGTYYRHDKVEGKQEVIELIAKVMLLGDEQIIVILIKNSKDDVSYNALILRKKEVENAGNMRYFEQYAQIPLKLDAHMLEHKISLKDDILSIGTVIIHTHNIFGV